MATPNIFALANGTPKVLVSSQVPNAEAAIFTTAANHATKITQGSFCNTSGAAVTVSLSIVPSGGTVGDGTHRLISNYSLAAGDTLSLRDYIADAMLGDGDRVAAVASVANAVDVVLTGVDFS